MKMFASRVFFTGWLCLATMSVCAGEFSVHGFVAQGLTQSINSHFITNNNEITTDLTEMGLNGRYQWSDDVSLVGQLTYLDGGNRFEQGTRLDYLFLDIHLPQIAGWDTHMHLGRFKNLHWLYSATRDVPHTRASIILPQSVYFDGFRDIALGSDGVLLQSMREMPLGLLEVNWSMGRSPFSDYETRSFLGDQAQGRARQDYVQQLSVYWQPRSLRWRIGVSGLDSQFAYLAAPGEALIDGQSHVQRLMVSAIYFAEHWELSSEWLREYQTDRGAFAPNFVASRIGEGGYIQGRYFLRPDLNVLARFDTYDFDRNNAQPPLPTLVQNPNAAPYFAFQDTYTLGMTWDIQPRLRLQMEHHWVHGGARLRGLINADTQINTAEYWRMWAAHLMYWF